LKARYFACSSASKTAPAGCSGRVLSASSSTMEYPLPRIFSVAFAARVLKSFWPVAGSILTAVDIVEHPPVNLSGPSIRPEK